MDASERARALFGRYAKNLWPYMPAGQEHVLLDWAESRGVVPGPRGVKDLQWLYTGRSDHSRVAPWLDHTSAWYHPESGRRMLLGQPYGVEPHLERLPGVEFFPEGAWYGLETVAYEIWQPDATPELAVKNPQAWVSSSRLRWSDWVQEVSRQELPVVGCLQVPKSYSKKLARDLYAAVFKQKWPEGSFTYCVAGCANPHHYICRRTVLAVTDPLVLPKTVPAN